MQIGFFLYAELLNLYRDSVELTRGFCLSRGGNREEADSFAFTVVVVVESRHLEDTSWTSAQ